MITLRNVSFSYQDTAGDGIHNISLQVKQGECLLLCGRSGCGKTTVTRLINGLIPHFHAGMLTGSVQVAGMDIAATPLHAIAARVGSVFQNPRSQFFNVDTDSEIVFGLENLAYPAAEIRRRLEQTVRELDLGSLLGRSIFQLSGGEKQKIAFASVYALAPAVYVLDEPSSNLDGPAVAALSRLLQQLKRQGKTIVIAEHRLYYLEGIADRVVYMEKGGIAAEYTGAAFRQMSPGERRNKGLRAMDLTAIPLPASAAGAGQPVLAIRNLRLACDQAAIAGNINLTAARGDVIGVIGSNGAGKSTFSQTLCGLRKEVSGLFSWEGAPVGPRQRLALSYLVMQDVNYQLFADSVEEECTLGIDRPAAARVAAVLQGLSLYEYRRRHPQSLSGGQKQRTAVAVSQLGNKELIIFDEPTSGLDFGGMLQVARLIRELAAAGKVVFLVTHDAELIASTCSRVLGFAGGTAVDGLTMTERGE